MEYEYRFPAAAGGFLFVAHVCCVAALASSTKKWKFSRIDRRSIEASDARSVAPWASFLRDIQSLAARPRWQSQPARSRVDLTERDQDHTT
jgi:hypothetical protein